MIALDTNLLVYAQREAVPEHRASRRAIERAATSVGGWGISLACIAEFWSVVTHAEAAGGPTPHADAARFLLALVRDGAAQVWIPGAGFDQRLLRLAVRRRVNGPRIHDLQIALTAYEAGAREIWTHDRDFVIIPGLRVHDPIDDAP